MLHKLSVCIFIIYNIFNLFSHKEETYTSYGNDGTYDFDEGNFLVEDEAMGEKDEDRSERHECLCNSCWCHLYCHEAEADTNEGT